MNTDARNEIWAKKLIDALIGQGVDYFCCAPGSRSTALSLAIANHPQAKWTVHFDERGLAFHALGYGKASNRPAVVMASSGTAIGNFLPAIMEASNDRTPLIILSADRPPELRDCGANQTCDQVKLFHNFVRWQVDLPCPEDHLSDRYLGSTISHAVMMASFPPAGPVHINCMFREPLFTARREEGSINKHTHVAQPELYPTKEIIDYWAEKLAAKKRQGIIVVGSSSFDLSEAVFSLAEKLQWPVFADVLSSLRRGGADHPSLITHFDPVLKLKNGIAIDAVIQFGNRFASKTLGLWLEKQTLDFYLQIAEQPVRQDPTHLATHRVLAAPSRFSSQLIASLQSDKEEEWLKQWREWDDLCRQRLAELFSADDVLTEPRLIREIGSFLSKDWNLFLANSMPIRDANQFFFPVSHTGPIFGNRGVSGIDGNLATACGLAQGNGKATLAVVGDLTFLHDLSSLAMVAKSPQPIVICIVNNDGGGIFSFLPISKRKEAFEEFIAAPHGIHFEAAASLFKIPYFHPKTAAELNQLLLHQGKNPHTCLIEITTDRTENVCVHEQIITEIGTCLNYTNSPSEIPVTLH